MSDRVGWLVFGFSERECSQRLGSGDGEQQDVADTTDSIRAVACTRSPLVVDGYSSYLRASLVSRSWLRLNRKTDKSKGHSMLKVNQRKLLT